MAGKQKVYEEAMAMAANYTWDQDWPNAVKSYRAALEELPQDIAALVGLGAAYCELEQYESAVRSLQRALQVDATNQDAMNKIGEALEKMGRGLDAAKTYVYSGNLYAKVNQLDNAITSWQKAIALNPSLDQARSNLAQAYARTGRKNEAAFELVTVAANQQHQNQPERTKQFLQAAQQLAPNNDYVIAATRAISTNASIQAVLQEMVQVDQVEPNLLDLDSPSEEEWFWVDGIDEEEEKGAANPREKASQLAMEALASILFEDGSQYENLSIKKLELDSYIGQAIDLQTRGRHNEAIQVYEKISAANFDHAAVHFVLANLYLKSGQVEKAMPIFNRAKKDKDYQLGTDFALGECYKQQGQVDQALRHFVQILKTIDLEQSHRANTQQLQQLYNALIDNYVKAGDKERTATFVDTLIAFLSSHNWEHKIASARQRLGIDDDSGVSAWIEFLEAGQTEVILSAMASTADYIRQNMLLTAAEACYRAIQQVPNYLPLHLRLAEIYLKQERIDNCIHKYLAVAEVYQIRDNTSQVSNIYQKVLKIAPMDVTVRTRLIGLSLAQGDYDAAMENYKTLAAAYYQLAQVDQSLGIFRDALKVAPKTSQPKNWQLEILHSMGDIYNQRVDWRNALRVYEQTLNIAPEDDRTLTQLIDLYFKTDQAEKAIQSLDKLTAIYVRQGKQTKALQLLQDLAETRPDTLLLRRKLAAFYGELNMKTEALEQYNILGELQLDAGLPDDAAHTIETILQLGPDNPENYQQLLAQIRGGI